MSDPGEPLTADTVEDETMRLLRLAGPRTPVSATRAARVRSAVRAEWQRGTRCRITRRRIVLAGSLGAAAALLVAVGRVVLLEPRAMPLGATVAVVDQVDGSPVWVAETLDGRQRARLQRGDSLRVGEWIETRTDSRVALRFGDGISVRLDTGSRVRPLSRSVIELSAGAVYVDTGRESGRFEVRTALATAHDIGTQFEVRLNGETLRLRVRTGAVELRDRARSISGRSGTEITLTATGAVSRPIAAHGSEWNWTTRVSPPLEMEGMPLATFLERVAREQGWTVEYDDPTIARETERIILHGSVTGLAPHDAVGVAVATSGLRYRLASGSLVVLRANAGDARKPGGRP